MPPFPNDHMFTKERYSKLPFKLLTCNKYINTMRKLFVLAEYNIVEEEVTVFISMDTPAVFKVLIVQ